MLCSADFGSQREIRFCPCCAMVSCAACVARRVFEVASRQMVSVCVHCFRESSRIRHPPSPSKGVSSGAAWWRRDEVEEAAAQTSSGLEEKKEEDTDDDEAEANKSVCLIPGLLRIKAPCCSFSSPLASLAHPSHQGCLMGMRSLQEQAPPCVRRQC